MPYDHPTLRQLINQAMQDVVASRIYDGTTGQLVSPLLLEFDPLSILAKVLAGMTYQVLEYADYIALQATPFSATDEAAIGWGALKGVTLKPPTAAIATASFNNLANAAVDIPVGTPLARADGLTYVTTADVVIPAGGSGLLTFQAAMPGATSTIAAGAAISLASPPAGMQQDSVVAASLAPGSDIETNDDFRARYLAEFNQPGQGGCPSDYVEWAERVPGVTRAWCAPNLMGPGTVGVFVMLDVSEANAGGFPVGSNGISALDNNSRPRDVLLATGDQKTVADALIPLQPVAALTYVLGPIPFPISFTFTSLGAANTATNQAAILAAWQDLLLAIGTPLGMTIQLPTLIGAVIAATGLSSFAMPQPAAAVIVPPGFLPTIGLPITFAS